MRLRLLFVLLLCVFLCGCFTSYNNQTYFRKVQVKNQPNPTNDVIRIYIDKYGYFYPNIAVPINRSVFMHPYNHVKDADTTGANLYYYFTTNTRPLDSLARFYKVNGSGIPDRIYNDVENKIVAAYADKIHQMVVRLHADRYVVFVHGFNVEDATEDYDLLKKKIEEGHYNDHKHMVFIEIYWDGLKNLNNKVTSAIKIWEHAQNNSRYVALALRKLLDNLQDPIPLVIITHSLGASVGTGALFNCTSKWAQMKNERDQLQLDNLMKLRTPTFPDIHLGMLAPAMPGVETFIDFNKRSPDIEAKDNRIYPIVIGYNPYDFAVSKWFLSAQMGATTLGCNYITKNQAEIDRVKKVLADSLKYDTAYVSKLIVPIKFRTKQKFPIIHLEEHGLPYYLKDTVNIKKFMDDLFL
ncbi:hypothetical protein SAMN05216490_2710 [Mucilaginibacter mallensis]|uniref:Alpha/beta hydrolase n=1 Tax=Mucilaginibacter mallensis TaxID=652787 RepID=A0A1H1YE46_MUCMA|nr:hypothetical protein [Mucilaginibacter mallensis]SDT19717.1 hypothetical protein SAMN05216490_2710 [Mucilaginibacter mallensis]